MKKSRVRVLIRFQPLISDCLEYEAAFEGIRVGTLANRLLQEELSKIEMVGARNCFVLDSEEYEDALAEIKQGRGVYIIPTQETISGYLPAKMARTINRQVTFWMTESQQELLNQIVRIQDIMGTLDNGKVASYRYAIHGLLLNNPVIQKLDETQDVLAAE